MSSRTIAAVSTPPGRGGVAIVRVSGPDAFDIHLRLAGFPARPGRISFARVCGDDCVVLAFKMPHSYTGEDVVEFQCHGGIVAPRRILEACFAAGAILAPPGEFTRRAFLNGRISAEHAQGVIDLIDAMTDRAAEAALSGLKSAVTRELSAVYDEILDIESTLEHALDVDEGDLPGDFMATTAERIAALEGAIALALKRLREREILRSGALVVISGPPNAGKSSLFNALVGENRAIVSPIPGTTRDAIEAWVDLSGWPVRLVDTAGLRDSEDIIESEGVERARNFASRADVVIDLSPTPAEEQKPSQKVIHVRSKSDLPPEERGWAEVCGSAHAPIEVSAVTRQGLEALTSAVAAALAALADDVGEAAPGALDESSSALANALASVSAARRAPEALLAANDLARAAKSIAPVIGAAYSPDLLDRLFSRFCVGK